MSLQFSERYDFLWILTLLEIFGILTKIHEKAQLIYQTLFYQNIVGRVLFKSDLCQINQALLRNIALSLALLFLFWLN